MCLVYSTGCVADGLDMQEIFLCSCYGALLARWQVLQSAEICLFIFFTKVWRIESSLEISIKAFLRDV